MLVDVAAIAPEHGLCTFKPVAGGTITRSIASGTPAPTACSPAQTSVNGNDGGSGGPRWPKALLDESARECMYGAFEKNSQALAGLEQALQALGLLDQAKDLDLRSPHQNFSTRSGGRAGAQGTWSTSVLGRGASRDRKQLTNGLAEDGVGRYS